MVEWIDGAETAGGFAGSEEKLTADEIVFAPCARTGTNAVWRYKAIYRLHDEEVGQWSDIATISVMG